MLSKLCSNPVSDDFINPPPSYLPIFMDQATRSKLLKEMPTLDDIDVAVRQVRDASWGVQIPRMDDTGVQVPRRDDSGGQGGSDPTPRPGKGKEKVETAMPASKAGSSSLPKDVGASSKWPPP
jgi:hypothetical protein